MNAVVALVGLRDRLATLFAGASRHASGQRCGGSSVTIWHRTRGSRAPSSGALTAIAEAYDASLDWLLPGRGAGPGGAGDTKTTKDGGPR